MKRYLLIVLSCFLTTITFGQSFLSENLPDRIILHLTNDPHHEMALNWRTNETSGQKQTAQLRIENNSPNFEDSILKTLKPVSTPFKDKENNISVYHAVTFDQLLPGTTYNYRVGQENEWSEWFQFKTAEKTDNFSFIYLGDAQNDLLSKWTRVYRKAIQTSPNASFVLHAGDLINRSHTDKEWGEWFYAGTGINSSYPQLMVPGNHEYFRDENKILQLDPHWKAQFNLPKNGAEGLDESNYFVDYNNLRIIALNTQIIMLDSIGREKQAKWLENVLKNNTQKWTVVLCHHPIYPTAKNRDNSQFSNLFQPLFEKYGVNLLLQGHDHTYARSPVLPQKPVYIVSVAGPKMYKVETQTNWMEKSLENTQVFQVINVTENKLSYKSYKANGDLLDEFELEK